MFAKRLKQLRAERGVNQVELAQAMGVTQGTVGNWETAKREPDSDMLRKLAEYFAVPIDFLLGGDEELALITRRLAGVPDADRELLINNLNSTIDAYMKSKGIST
jgi:transcriptional regulator with XRE-family HTH domain